MEYLEGQDITLMSHSAYSLHLSSCDFCLFPKIIEQFYGKNVEDMNEVDAVVQEQMEGRRKEDFYRCSEY